MVFRTVINLSKRLPLIKFRKGAHQASSTPSPDTTQQPSLTPQNTPNVVEDWELPSRYKRRPISTDEMEYINRGGPA